jgi:hypothetical protein
MKTNDVQQDAGQYLRIDEWLGESDEPVRAFAARLIEQIEARSPRRSAPEQQQFLDWVICHRRVIAGSWWRQPAAATDLQRAGAIVAAAFNFGPRRNPNVGPYDMFNSRVPESARIPEQYHPQFHYPGGTNDEIARVVYSVRDQGLEKEIFGQIEVIESLRLQFGLCLPDERAAMPAADYLSTTGVMQQLIGRGLADYDVIIAVGHPDHVQRVAAAADTAVNVARAAEGLRPAEVITPDCAPIRYHGDGVQEWPRDLCYREHEAAARVRALYCGQMRLDHLA